MTKLVKPICEFGKIHKIEDYNREIKDTFQNIYIDELLFNELVRYIEVLSSQNDDVDKAFSIFRTKGKQHIKVKNYVGLLEIKNKIAIEVLPKIFLDDTKDEIASTRKIFLQMLRHLKNSPFLSISEAHLQSVKNFPMLEIFIETFLKEIKKVISFGLKKDYINNESNQRFIKGKLLVHKHLQKNIIHKEKFFVSYNSYELDIAHNRILLACLNKISKISSSSKNIFLAKKYESFFQGVSESKNITIDFKKIENGNRLYKRYNFVIKWAEVFLLNKSFTNFHGNNKNQSILYPMEKIFEDYIGSILKKYVHGMKIKTQDKSYFLVDEHKNKGKFRLKPDVVLEDESKTIIIDTKWKLLNSKTNKRNYNITSADMYQLYAYGKKYSKKLDHEPKLILLYPKNKYFDQKLDKFIYEGDLYLEVVPFDFEKDIAIQIENMI